VLDDQDSLDDVHGENIVNIGWESVPRRPNVSLLPIAEGDKCRFESCPSY